MLVLMMEGPAPPIRFNPMDDSPAKTIVLNKLLAFIAVQSRIQ